MVIMPNIRNIRLEELSGRLGNVAYQLTQVKFSQFAPAQAWRPAINAYRCQGCMMICLDLAGVDRERLNLRVEPQRLLIRGVRQRPEPAGERGGEPLQILAMEIDYGPFEREISFNVEVEPEAVTAEQRNGLVWIHLPIRSQT